MSSLIKQLTQGDSEAVLRFYKLCSLKILTYLERRLPTADDAQEITNDVFLEALDSISLLKDEKKLPNWLYRIAHNKACDFYRKRKIKSLLFSQIPFLQIVSKEINEPEFQFEKDRLRDRIETALRNISKEYRRILKLHYEEEIPVRQIAVMSDLSFKATESLLFRARQSFKLAYDSSKNSGSY